VIGMSSYVLQTVPLGPGPWPTIDPFLFCVRHHDDYPVGNAELGPTSSLAGREIGSDFSGKDGWSMYHGDVVPGFPQHPHRGFETVTFVRNGMIDHSDSMGASARFGRGDVQWMTAGSGIVHSEMFPLLNDDAPNPVELFQIWVNLPGVDKMVEPYFTMLWDHTVPRHHSVDAQGRETVITVVAGTFDGLVAPTPPPNSWASHADADFAIWQIHLQAGATTTLPPAAREETARLLYIYEGSGITIGDERVPGKHGAAVRTDVALTITADADVSVELLVLQARPIGEPVAQYGPFVMNTKAEIDQAFRDYQRTQFGGWPWNSDAPTHERSQERFARHVDGRVETPTVVAS
jgi:quercetin 2,3-dioxygenase